MSVQLNAFLSMSNHASWTFDKCLCLCATSFNTLYFIVQHKNSRQHKKYEYEPWKCCSSIRSACLKSKLNTNCKIRRFLSLKWKLGFPFFAAASSPLKPEITACENSLRHNIFQSIVVYICVWVCCTRGTSGPLFGLDIHVGGRRQSIWPPSTVFTSMQSSFNCYYQQALLWHSAMPICCK